MGKRRKLIIFVICMLISLMCAQFAFADSEDSYRIYYDGKAPDTVDFI